MPRKPNGNRSKRTHITLDDVAQACGLSKMTVSRVLRDSDKVSAKTRELVLETARSLGYMRNRLAASFGAQESNMIGFVVPEVYHSFFPMAMMGAEPLLNKHGYLISLCCSYGRADKERAEVQALLEWRVDGIIIAPVSSTESAETLREILAVDCPLVCLDRIVPDVAAHAVVTDHYNGARAAVTHLVAQGYRRIAHIAGPRNVWVADERRRGYEDALAEAGRVLQPRLVRFGPMNYDTGREATEALFSRADPPDAVFCSNDLVATGVLAVLNERGILVPDQVGVVGFADIVNNEVMHPPLSSVTQEPRRLGERCAKRLLEQIRGTAGPPERVVHEALLVARRSSTRRA